MQQHVNPNSRFRDSIIEDVPYCCYKIKTSQHALTYCVLKTGDKDGENILAPDTRLINLGPKQHVYCIIIIMNFALYCVCLNCL